MQESRAFLYCHRSFLHFTDTALGIYRRSAHRKGDHMPASQLSSPNFYTSNHCYYSCEDCRRSTGSVYSVDVIVPKESVYVPIPIQIPTLFSPHSRWCSSTYPHRKLNEECKTYECTGSSGKAVHRYFCPHCGSPLGTYMENTPAIMVIKSGTLTEDIQKVNTYFPQVFCIASADYRLFDRC